MNLGRSSRNRDDASVGAGANKSVFERMLAVVTEVRAGEAPTALLMTFNGFLLLMAYYCIKPVREALILAEPGGPEYKVYMSAVTAAILIFAVPAYGRFSRNMPRNRLIVVVTLFFASNLVIFYSVGGVLGSSLAFALAFYVWISVFNMMIVAQFWAFANDIYVEETGKRLFPLIGLGLSVGAVAGSAVARLILAKVGTMPMMLVAAVILLCSAAVTEWVHQREVRRASSSSVRETAVRAIGGTSGEAFRAVMTHRYLLFIALFSLVFTLVKTNGDYLLARVVKAAAEHAIADGSLKTAQVEDFIGTFFAGFELKVDLISLVIQAFAVSRLVKYLGIRGAFYILPIIALGDATTMAAIPILVAVSIGKIAESAVDYSLNNTLRNMLWLPTARRQKYLAKQATDTFFVRMGDVVSAALVFVGIQAIGLSMRGFAFVNIALVGVWFLLAHKILEERARLTRDPDGKKRETGGAS